MVDSLTAWLLPYLIDYLIDYWSTNTLINFHESHLALTLAIVACCETEQMHFTIIIYIFFFTLFLCHRSPVCRSGSGSSWRCLAVCLAGSWSWSFPSWQPCSQRWPATTPPAPSSCPSCLPWWEISLFLMFLLSYFLISICMCHPHAYHVSRGEETIFLTSLFLSYFLLLVLLLLFVPHHSNNDFVRNGELLFFHFYCFLLLSTCT